MCATYVLSDEDNAEIRKIISEVESRSGEAVRTGDIYPKQKAPVLLSDGPEPITWGFPQWKGNEVIYNARSETAAEKPTFRDSLLKRRCVIPATAFYEWSKDKKRHRFWLPGNDALYLGGIYADFQGERRFTILTADANDSVSPVHHRMPIILQKDDFNTWFEDYAEALRMLVTGSPELENRIA